MLVRLEFSAQPVNCLWRIIQLVANVCGYESEERIKIHAIIFGCFRSVIKCASVYKYVVRRNIDSIDLI